LNPPHHRSGRSWGRAFLARNLIILCGIALLVGCNTERSHRWLTVFFDGVPQPGTTNHPPANADAAPNQFALARSRPATNESLAARTTFVSHTPFEDRQCTECHKSQFDVSMKGTQREVCFACHDDFLQKPKFKHQPAENSECTSCHQPHGSPNKGMVKLVGKALCLDCHDDPVAKVKFTHQPVESGCQDCHQVHASDQPKLLKKTSRELCMDCHDDPLAKAKFKHQPAESGCLDCHAAHGSAESKLLPKPVDKLCLDCHEQKDIDASKGHKNIAGMACLKCHDAHAGSEQYLLKPEFLKAMGAGVTTPVGK
jgi:predicted CXXCH cytochrome family protein